MTVRRPLKPIGYVFVPLAFCLTRARPIFDAIWPEPTKYKYRVDSRTDAEKAEPIVAEKQTGAK